VLKLVAEKSGAAIEVLRAAAWSEFLNMMARRAQDVLVRLLNGSATTSSS